MIDALQAMRIPVKSHLAFWALRHSSDIYNHPCLVTTEVGTQGSRTPEVPHPWGCYSVTAHTQGLPLRLHPKAPQNPQLPLLLEAPELRLFHTIPCASLCSAQPLPWASAGRESQAACKSSSGFHTHQPLALQPSSSAPYK